MDLVREIQTAVRTGKVAMGFRESLKAIVNGRAKLVLIASNAPSEIRRDVAKCCKVSGTPLLEFPGTSWDLGAACGKPFMVSVLTILDPGESGILDLAKGEA